MKSSPLGNVALIPAGRWERVSQGPGASVRGRVRHPHQAVHSTCHGVWDVTALEKPLLDGGWRGDPHPLHAEGPGVVCGELSPPSPAPRGLTGAHPSA